MTERWRDRASPTLMVIVLIAIVVLVAAFPVVKKYGGESFLPGLIAGFIATLLAFMLALAWEQERERIRLEREAESERIRLAEEAQQLKEQRETEIKRRLQPVRVELETNLASLEALATVFETASEAPGLGHEGFQIAANPQLLEGAWSASAPRLAALIADYELIADLATAYGRIEELRWRIRYRTSQSSTMLDGITAPFVSELHTEITDLLERVRQQITEPDLQPLNLLLADVATPWVIMAGLYGRAGWWRNLARHSPGSKPG